MTQTLKRDLCDTNRSIDEIIGRLEAAGRFITCSTWTCVGLAGPPGAHRRDARSKCGSLPSGKATRISPVCHKLVP